MRVEESNEPPSIVPRWNRTPDPVQPGEARKGRGLGFGLIFLVLVAMAAIGWFVYKGISSRVSAEKALVVETHDAAILTVSVTHPKVTGATQELVLPGNTQPLIDAPVYARTSGYLTKWYADIGTRVKAGEVLADIETPEVDHQLQQAKADVETAQANLNLAKLPPTAWSTLAKEGRRGEAGYGQRRRRHELEEGHRGFRDRERQEA